jgi:hypothetical protein
LDLPSITKTLGQPDRADQRCITHNE